MCYSDILATVKRKVEEPALCEKENALGVHIIHPLGVVPTTSPKLHE
jgi:hypothetical protein